MGGNAIKNYETGRLAADEYFKLTSEFSEKFAQRFGFLPVLIRAYANKPTFGDADFLVESSLLPDNWTDVLKDEFTLTPEQFVKNGDVVSIGWKNFQFDLIKTLDVRAAEFYFSFNDFGNLVGRLTHKLGVKFGHTGLSIVVRQKDRSDHILKEIHLSSEPRDVCDLLGLNYDRYLQGFDELEDMFLYISSSKWFNKDIYLFDNRNSTSRRRDQKRATYNAFLQWCETSEVPNNHVFEQKTELGGHGLRIPYYETEVLPRWPWAKPMVDDVIATFELDNKFSQVYNGKVVESQTGYTGKTLGAFMAKMRQEITPQIKQIWIERPHLVDLAIAQKFLQIGGITFKAE